MPVMPVIVKRLHSGGQAESNGIMAGWKLAKINGESIEGLSLSDIHALLIVWV